jgi:DNA-binding SARP family transcriptional activator/Tfp pilus assembly protein PilF
LEYLDELVPGRDLGPELVSKCVVRLERERYRVSVRFRILGPIEVEAGGRVLPVPRRRERCLLGVLLLEANRVVSVDRLAELLWDGDPPKRVRGAVQGLVSRVRSALAMAADGDNVELTFVGDGYRLVIDPDTVDAHQFRGLRERAALVEDLAEQVALLRTALDLWRGPALVDAVSDSARERLCADLEEQRLAAAEEFASASLTLRRERELLSRLAQVVNQNLGRERLVGLHMRALYQAGRRAEALDLYARARRYLSDELGIDPDSELRELHQAILRDEVAVPQLVTPAAEDHPERGSPGRIVPRQLPADVRGFTGRSEELDQLDRLLHGGQASTSVVVTAIGGNAGVGKTALAVHWAHRVSERFPDAQIFVDLHGFTGGVAPVKAEDALDRLLRALGVPGGQIPVELDDRAALWRSVLAGRKMLIVLDNAATEAQVAPMLPGVPGSLVLVTSRRRLVGLDPTHTVTLDTLPAADALSLFARTAGQDRLTNQPRGLVAETIELCGHLPLAIRIAAARLRSHPVWTLGDLVERLRDEDQRLAELADGPRGVAGALDVSYGQLDAEQQRLYRLLGLHPGPDVEPYAAAALADLGHAQARRCLDRLLDAHLLQEPTAGRLVFHDLVRAHAAHVATAAETDASRRAAMSRLLDYYRHSASLAMDVAYPYERERRPHVAPTATRVPDLSDPVHAIGWLDTELPNILAAAQHAAGDAPSTYVLDLSGILHRHLGTRGRYHDVEALHQRALVAARATGVQEGEITALIGLSYAYRAQCRYEDATVHLGQALQLARTNGHHVGEVDALTGLAWVHRRHCRYEQAADHYERALRLARTSGHQVGELDSLDGLGRVRWLQGRYQQATDYLGQALQLARANGHRVTELTALTGLARVHFLQGQYEQAIEHSLQVLQLARAIGHRAGEVDALSSLGRHYSLQGRNQQATDHLGQALELARASGNRVGELTALTGLGQVRRVLGQHNQAADHFRQLLDLAQEVGERNFEYEARQGLGRLQEAVGDAATALAYHQQALALATDLEQLADEARAHDGLARAHVALGQPVQARQHWRRALEILTRLGTDHTEEPETSTSAIHARLAALDQVNDVPEPGRTSNPRL